MQIRRPVPGANRARNDRADRRLAMKYAIHDTSGLPLRQQVALMQITSTTVYPASHAPI